MSNIGVVLALGVIAVGFTLVGWCNLVDNIREQRRHILLRTFYITVAIQTLGAGIGFAVLLLLDITGVL